MQITYTTTLDDYVAFNRRGARKSAVLWLVFLLGWVSVPTLAVAAGAALAAVKDLWPIGLIVIVAGLLVAAFYPFVYRWLFDEIIRAYARGLGTRGMLGRTTLVLTDETLVEITETTRSEVRWEDLQGVEVAGDYTFIFVTGLSAAILPRRGCVCDEDYEAARDFALAQVAKAAKPDTAPDRGR